MLTHSTHTKQEIADQWSLNIAREIRAKARKAKDTETIAQCNAVISSITLNKIQKAVDNSPVEDYDIDMDEESNANYTDEHNDCARFLAENM